MALTKPVPNAKSKVRATVDTMLLSTLVNKLLNCEHHLFHVQIEFLAANETWRVWVQHFKGTYIQVDPDSLAKYEQMQKLSVEIADKLLEVMKNRKETTKFGDTKMKKSNEVKNESV